MRRRQIQKKSSLMSWNEHEHRKQLEAIASEFEPIRNSEPNDLYPGTFFRIPGVPIPGQTAWSLSE